MAEALEAVLLVEPLATISALEDYIWDKHGPKQLASPASTPSAAAAAAAVGGGSSCSTPAAGSAGGSASTGAARSGPPSGRGRGPAGVAGAGAASSTAKAHSTPQSPAAPGAGQSEAHTPRLRLSGKQPPIGLLRTMSGDSSPAAAEQPPTPLAIVDPGTPSGLAALAAEAFDEMRGSAGAEGYRGAAPQMLGDRGSELGHGQAPCAPASGGGGEARRRVRIYLNGQLLSSKTSIVQSLVSSASRLSSGQMPSGRVAAVTHEQKGPRSERFLACAEEADSGSDGEGAAFDLAGPGGSIGSSGSPGIVGPQASPRHFCGAIWGRVHTMTYEIVADDSCTPSEHAGADAKAGGAGSSAGDFVSAPPLTPAYVATDFDALVQRHARVARNLGSLQEQSTGQNLHESAAAAAATDSVETSGPGDEQDTPRSGGDREADDPAAGGPGFMAGLGPDQEALTTMLQLISAFYNICEYLRANRTDFAVPDAEIFHCSSLTAALLRQLSDPLAVCTGSVPPWCTKLSGACRFLFPQSVRRILHHSCNLGLSRALHHVQQRALAQHAHSQETQRRLEGEVAVASIPRQKVRISRQRILESAVKVLNLYGDGSAILEVEYVGEVGTGSGPTLEFYAQVADILRSSEPQLFRQGAPNGMLFPAPRDPEWLSRAQDQAAQQVLERFRLLGQVVAKCILDGRLVDIQLHPLFWRSVLNTAPFTRRSLHDVDPELSASMTRLQDMDREALGSLCVDFTLPGNPHIELRPGGADMTLSGDNLDDYVDRVAEVTLVTAVAPQVQAFRSAFNELLSLEACSIWSEMELASIIAGASIRDDTFWTLEHLGAHIKAQHGYCADSRCFRDLLGAMAEFKPEDRRRFLTFVTGAPSLPIAGFAGLKPPLTVVKKEAPPPPLTTDQFMPSVMTCANYLKLPEYSAAEILRQKLELAMSEGQSAFLLS